MSATPSPAAARFAAARACVLLAAIMSCLACALTPLGWWALLPLLALQLEAFALLHDARVLGRVTRRPSPKASFENPSATFTWQELARHNAEESAWVAVDGLVYDITEFVDRHPGGKEILLFALGRDATNLFNSYHPFTDVPRVVLKKYRIGSLATFEHPVYKPDSGFYKEASQVLKRYFEENGVDSKNPWNGVVRMAPVYVCFFAAYYAIYCVPGVPFAARVALAVLLGVCQGMPLTGWMHDASHVSIGRSEKWWWGVGRFSLDYMSGSSMVSWRNQHVLGHHVYTNVMGADPDLPTDLAGDPRRLVQQQAWASVYRWQHLYLPPLYGILALKSRMQDLTEVFSKHTNGPIRVNPISVQDYLRMLSAKAVWLFYRVVVPYVFLTAVSRPQLAVLFLATEFTTGYWLAFNFQVSHISDEVDFLFSDTAKRESGKCPAVYEQEWAESQIKTTIDYSHDSPLAAYFSGALNYQTIHHLFPCVSQYHYPTINPLIMDVAKKYGYEFKVYDSYADALAAHIRHLRNLGREGKPAELKLE